MHGLSAVTTDLGHRQAMEITKPLMNGQNQAKAAYATCGNHPRGRQFHSAHVQEQTGQSYV